MQLTAKQQGAKGAAFSKGWKQKLHCTKGRVAAPAWWFALCPLSGNNTGLGAGSSLQRAVNKAHGTSVQRASASVPWPTNQFNAMAQCQITSIRGHHWLKELRRTANELWYGARESCQISARSSKWRGWWSCGFHARIAVPGLQMLSQSQDPLMLGLGAAGGQATILTYGAACRRGSGCTTSKHGCQGMLTFNITLGGVCCVTPWPGRKEEWIWNED